MNYICPKVNKRLFTANSYLHIVLSLKLQLVLCVMCLNVGKLLC
jgi:hypothetical protein